MGEMLFYIKKREMKEDFKRIFTALAQKYNNHSI